MQCDHSSKLLVMPTRKAVLNGSTLATSRIGFGCASLHHVLTLNQRIKILECALEVGIFHFDAARMYGNGLAERALGALAKNRRSHMVIATKFGIPAQRLLESLPILQLPTKVVSRLLRPIIGNHQTAPHADRFSLAEAERNLTLSLRATQSEYIDLLMLHEPLPAEAVAIHALNDWAERKRRDGLVRHFGLAGTYAIQVGEMLQDSPWSEIRQAPVNWKETLDPKLDHATCRAPQIVYGVFTSRSQTTNFTETQSAIAAKQDLLRNSLLNNPGATVLISSTKEPHIRSAKMALDSVIANE